uniref:Pectinesterase n=1 Tax=Setaria viridis TaxID=4556 RepID=A0A4U6VNN8_SETVI|nr:hypothetical protein SEVIR_3G388300v2 [Setaria viridis]
MARYLTIKNTAGVDAGPAVALMITADRSICYRCEIDGYQDTLNADCNRQFYHTCNISGQWTSFLDVFQQCNLLVRLPVADGHCVITAQGRDAPNDHSGFVFQDSTVAALPGVDLTGVPTYLGRPWKNHSHVVFMNCLLEGIIHPAGWESGFMARDLTIKNTTGVDAGPAVALMIMADRSICYRCEIDGYQDTLNAECNRQFYHTCNISGTVDFVFGCAKDVFQQCNLLVRLPMADGHCVITAQGRDAPNDHSGFVFQDSTVAALPGVDLTGVPTYLGRPWKNHSHVVFMNCLLDGIIHPAGWERWGDKDWTPYSTGNSRIGGTAPTPKGASKVYPGRRALPEFGVNYKGGLE